LHISRDPKDSEVVKCVVEGEDKEILALKKQLNMLEVEPVHTTKVVKLQQEKEEFVLKLVEAEKEKHPKIRLMHIL